MPRYFVIARDPLIAAETVASRLPAGLHVERYYAGELDLDAIFVQLGSGDLFASERAIHYIDFLSLKLLSKKDVERLEGIFAHLPEEITLVCSQVLNYATRGEENKALKSQTYQRWVGAEHVDDVRGLSEGRQAVDWLRRRAKQKYGLVLKDDQLQAILAANDDRPALVDGELRKLWMMMPDDQSHEVSDKLLHAAISTSRGARFYELVDAILAQAQDTQVRLVQWFSVEPETHRLVGELRRRLLGLLALSRNEPVQPPFLAQQLRRVAHRWPQHGWDQRLWDWPDSSTSLSPALRWEKPPRTENLGALQLYLADLARPA